MHLTFREFRQVRVEVADNPVSGALQVNREKGAGHFGLSGEPDFGNVSSNFENGSWLAWGYNVGLRA